jgi:uncharacterized RDD family membrane protein YckC
MSSEIGAYYNRESYAGIWRRIFVDIIDGAFILGLSLMIFFLLSEVIQTSESLGRVVFIVLITLWIGYFVILKGSKYRTIGYILGGVKIVNLQGNRPSTTSLLLRFMFAALGPFNMLLDLFWIPDATHKQALRDKFANTYVVKRTAQIAGNGNIKHNYYEILGWNFLFQEVETPTDKDIQTE